MIIRIFTTVRTVHNLCMFLIVNLGIVVNVVLLCHPYVMFKKNSTVRLFELIIPP